MHLTLPGVQRYSESTHDISELRLVTAEASTSGSSPQRAVHRPPRQTPYGDRKPLLGDARRAAGVFAAAGPPRLSQGVGVGDGRAESDEDEHRVSFKTESLKKIKKYKKNKKNKKNNTLLIIILFSGL